MCFDQLKQAKKLLLTFGRREGEWIDGHLLLLAVKVHWQRSELVQQCEEAAKDVPDGFIVVRSSVRKKG